jgi:hypothetical protein
MAGSLPSGVSSPSKRGKKFYKIGLSTIDKDIWLGPERVPTAPFYRGSTDLTVKNGPGLAGILALG